MGFFSNLWQGIKNVGSKIGEVVKSGVEKVGEVIRNPAKIGEIGGKIVDVAKTLSPILGNVPVLGSIVKGVAGAGDIVKGVQQAAEQFGRGDILGGLKTGLQTGARFAPGPINKILPVLDTARRFAADY